MHLMEPALPGSGRSGQLTDQCNSLLETYRSGATRQLLDERDEARQPELAGEAFETVKDGRSMFSSNEGASSVSHTSSSSRQRTPGDTEGVLHLSYDRFLTAIGSPSLYTLIGQEGWGGDRPDNNVHHSHVRLLPQRLPQTHQASQGRLAFQLPSESLQFKHLREGLPLSEEDKTAEEGEKEAEDGVLTDREAAEVAATVKEKRTLQSPIKVPFGAKPIFSFQGSFHLQFCCSCT